MTASLADRVERVLLGVDHAEGIAIDPAGWVWCGGEAGQIYRSRLDDAPTVIAELPALPFGFALDGHGDAYCCCIGAVPGLHRVTSRGETALVSAGSPDRPVQIPNHPLFLPDGRLLFTDSGAFGASNGCIFEIGADGRTQIADTTCAGFPNGLALSPDGRTMAVVESNPPLISTLQIAADGTLGGRRLLAELPGTVPDGVAFDERGRLLVSLWVPDAVLLIEPDGRIGTLLEDRLRQHLISPTNLAFVPGTADVVCANIGSQFLSRFRHECLGADLARPLNPPAMPAGMVSHDGPRGPQPGLDDRRTPTTEAAA